MKRRSFLFAFLFCIALVGSAALFTVFTAKIVHATRGQDRVATGTDSTDSNGAKPARLFPADMETCKELASAVREGPEALLAKIREGDLPAPLIHSKWYVDERIAKEFPDALETENAIREFGRAWLVRLEEESRTLRALTTNEEREAKARTLLDLADWIGSAGGYGNVWLFYRLQDLANVPIGHLLSDNDYPTASLEQIVPRLRDNMGIFTTIGISALNSEAPEPVFKAGTVKTGLKNGRPRTKWDREGDIQAPSFSAWQKKYIEAFRLLEKTKKEGEYVRLLSGAEQRGRLPENLRFFIDDSDDDSFDDRPFTALAHWDDKFHYKFLLGLVGHKIQYSLALMEFRRKVGRIPEPYAFTPEEIEHGTKEKEDYAKRGVKIVPFWEAPDFDALEFAFEKAWKALPGIPPDDRNLDTDACHIYKLVRENKLIDDDADASERWNAEQERISKIRKQAQEREEEENGYVRKMNDLTAAHRKTNEELWPLTEQYEKIEKELAISRDYRLYEGREYVDLLRKGQIREADEYAAKKRTGALQWIKDPEQARKYEEIARRMEEAIKKDVDTEQKHRQAVAEYREYRARRDAERMKAANPPPSASATPESATPVPQKK